MSFTPQMFTDASSAFVAESTIPEQIAAVKAKSSLAQTMASRAADEYQGTKDYQKALKDSPAFVDPESTMTPEQKAENDSKNIWADSSQMHDATRQYQKDQQEYSNMLSASKNLQGDDLSKNQTLMEQKRQHMEQEQTKLIDLQTKVGDARLYQLSKITDEPSLQGARQWEMEQLGKVFDKQVPIKDGQSPEQYAKMKGHFLQEHDKLPQKYDDQGKAQINNVMTRGGSEQEALQFLRIQAENQKTEAYIKAMGDRERANIILQSRLSASADDRTYSSTRKALIDVNKATLTSYDREASRIRLTLSDLQDPNRGGGRQGPIGGFLGFGQHDSPKALKYDEQVQQLTDQLGEITDKSQKIKDDNRRLGIELQDRLGMTSPKDTPTPSTPDAKTAMVDAAKGGKQDTFLGQQRPAGASDADWEKYKAFQLHNITSDDTAPKTATQADAAISKFQMLMDEAKKEQDPEKVKYWQGYIKRTNNVKALLKRYTK